MDNNQLSWWDNDETPVMQSTNKLSVAKLDFIEGQEVEWQELFEGFSSIKVITYSSSLSFISKVIELFDDAEIIFGCQQVMTYDLCEIMAFQLALVENIRKSKSKDKLISRIKDKTLQENSFHTKKYICFRLLMAARELLWVQPICQIVHF